jgi:plasmid stabilization system protein ParE
VATRRVRLTPQAERDIDRAVVYLATEADVATGIRQWKVSTFDKYLIFYRIVSSGIDIIRVLHGARDIDRILDEEIHQ